MSETAIGRIKADLMVVAIAGAITLLSLAGGVVVRVFLWSLIDGPVFAAVAAAAAVLAIILIVAGLIVRTRISVVLPVAGILIGFVFSPIILLYLYLALGGEFSMD